MGKTILIFGAGINQLELIREAKKLGIFTVAIDPAEDPLGKIEADIYYQVDGRDYETTKKIADIHNVDGIVTGQMEKPMRLMAKLAQENGYIFHKSDVVERSLNKELMKKAFISSNVNCAKGVVFYEGDLIQEKTLKVLNYPMIIKPVDAFSSRGVIKVSNFDEIMRFEQESRSYSNSSTIIIEEFLEGKEFSVESITFKGKTTIVQITEKFITPYPNTVELSHLQPARISEKEKYEIEILVKKAIKAIGIDNSASHAEVMLTAKGPYMIEIGARLGGDFISSYLTKSSTGISLDKAAIQVALGLKPDLINKQSKFSMIKYVELEAGNKIKEIKPLKELELKEGYVFSYVFIKAGNEVEKITHSAQRPACILFEADDLNTLFARINDSERLLKSKIIYK